MVKQCYLPWVQNVHGLKRSHFNKIRPALSVDLPKGKPGVATLIDLEAAHEIGFIAALLGKSPISHAAATARTWLNLWRRGGPQTPYWLYPVGSGMVHRSNGKKTLALSLTECTQQIDFPLSQRYRPAANVVCINVQEIIQRNEIIAEMTASRMAEIEAEADD